MQAGAARPRGARAGPGGGRRLRVLHGHRPVSTLLLWWCPCGALLGPVCVAQLRVLVLVGAGGIQLLSLCVVCGVVWCGVYV